MNTNNEKIMHRVFISLGTNLGRRVFNLQNAIKVISDQIGSIECVGDLYETEPWGFDSENWFVNTVIELETTLNPDELLQKCLWIENNLGRNRTKIKTGYSSRLIDIDILFFNSEIINSSKLTIPHEHLHKRKFVLAPLSDIAPEFVHPGLKKSVKKLLENCSDEMELKKLNQKIEI